jgi:divalent metal cation (Fe/Co/Zn/Cd) transporter
MSVESGSAIGPIDENAAEIRRRLISRVLWLSWFTIGYNLIEGFVSIGFGVSEGSVALAGFGADSLVEVASAIVVLWRFRTETEPNSKNSVERERRATLGIGALFLVLAALTAVASAIQLWTANHPETTLPGLIISALSLSFMFFLWTAKRKVGTALSSPTVLQDAACSLACIKLSVVLFVGSLVYLLVPSLWWADSAAALGLAVLIAREGKEAIEAARSENFAGGCCGCDS